MFYIHSGRNNIRPNFTYYIGLPKRDLMNQTAAALQRSGCTLRPMPPQPPLTCAAANRGERWDLVRTSIISWGLNATREQGRLWGWRILGGLGKAENAEDGCSATARWWWGRREICPGVRARLRAMMHTSERAENEYDRVLSRSVSAVIEKKNILARTSDSTRILDSYATTGPGSRVTNFFCSFYFFISFFASKGMNRW
jgi:hypothetical protein